MAASDAFRAAERQKLVKKTLYRSKDTRRLANFSSANHAGEAFFEWLPILRMRSAMAETRPIFAAKAR